MALERIILSGSPDAKGSAIDGLATFASLTTIHTVPTGEVHTIWLTVTNNGANSIEILGDMGATATAIDIRILAHQTMKMGPFTLSDTTIKLGAIANGGEISVSGSVEKYTADE